MSILDIEKRWKCKRCNHYNKPEQKRCIECNLIKPQVGLTVSKNDDKIAAPRTLFDKRSSDKNFDKNGENQFRNGAAGSQIDNVSKKNKIHTNENHPTNVDRGHSWERRESRDPIENNNEKDQGKSVKLPSLLDNMSFTRETNFSRRPPFHSSSNLIQLNPQKRSNISLGDLQDETRFPNQKPEKGFKEYNKVNILNKLRDVFKGGPTINLHDIDLTEKKFNGRSRLFVGNIGDGTTESQLKELLIKYGEVGETYFDRDKRFAFFRMSTRSEAEEAKSKLDNYLLNGRNLKIRISAHKAAIKVSNFSSFVSNELLYLAFSIFGEIERVKVLYDERSQESKQEGFVEFVKKQSAEDAVKWCTENCYFLTQSLRPVFVELVDGCDPDEVGLQEEMMKKHPNQHKYKTERQSIPRFAKSDSFEFEYAQKWKNLHAMKKEKMEALNREMKLEEEKLVAQLESSRYDGHKEIIRSTYNPQAAFYEEQKQIWAKKIYELDMLIKNERDKELQINQVWQNEFKTSLDSNKSLKKSLDGIPPPGSNRYPEALKIPFLDNLEKSKEDRDNPQHASNSFRSVDKEKVNQLFPNLSCLLNTISSNSERNEKGERHSLFPNLTKLTST